MNDSGKENPSNRPDDQESWLQIIQSGLESCEARYRLLAENAADVIWIMDLHGCYTYISPSVERLLGFSVEEAMRQTIDETFSAESAINVRERIKHMLRQLVAHENVDQWFFEVEQICKDGSRVWNEFTTSRLTTSNGEIVGILGVSRNITKRHRALMAEQEQRTMAEALRDSAAALNSAMGLDEVLNVFLSIIEQVVPHDTVEILLVDPDGLVHTAGSESLALALTGHSHQVFDLNLPVSQIPNLAQMAATGKPCLIDNLREYPWVPSDSTRWAKSHLGAPILVKGKAVGFIILLSAKIGFFDPKYIERLQIFADQAAVAIEKARLFEQLNEMAITDSLTELSNRRHFFNLAETELTRAIRYQHPLSALMMDIDHFKQVNDNFGHSIGDHILHGVAQRCYKAMRSHDLIGRYGGEEFSFILPETSLDEAVNVAERLREIISKNPFPIQNGNIHVTVSIGVAEFQSQIPSARALLDLADQALYQAKQAGRNRVLKLE